MFRTIFSSISLMLIMGCASTPQPLYYTLDMEASGQAKPSVNVDVDRLMPSESLARTDILIKKSQMEIEYYALHKWASNLGELVREKLESEFGPHNENRKTILISGKILSFEQVDSQGGAKANIKLELAFRNEEMRSHDKPLLKKVYKDSIPTESKTPASVVNALSDGLEKIAAMIVQDANKL